MNPIPSLVSMALCALAQTASPLPSARHTLPPNPYATPLLTPTNIPEPTIGPRALPAMASSAHFKHLKRGTLSFEQVAYALAHPVHESELLAQMKTVKVESLRVVRLPAAYAASLHWNAERESSSRHVLHDRLALVNVSNALQNVNGLPVSGIVTLQTLLNRNSVATRRVAGVYIGGGIVSVIVK